MSLLSPTRILIVETISESSDSTTHQEAIDKATNKELQDGFNPISASTATAKDEAFIHRLTTVLLAPQGNR